jgi:hypothetical protein
LQGIGRAENLTAMHGGRMVLNANLLATDGDLSFRGGAGEALGEDGTGSGRKS